MSTTARVLTGLVAGIVIGILLAWTDPALAHGIANIVEPFDRIERLCQRRHHADAARFGSVPGPGVSGRTEKHHGLRVARADDLEAVHHAIVQGQVQAEGARDLAAGARRRGQHAWQEVAVAFQPDLRLQLHGISGARRTAGHEEHFPPRRARLRVQARYLIGFIGRNVEPPVRRRRDDAPEPLDIRLRQPGFDVAGRQSQFPLRERVER